MNPEDGAIRSATLLRSRGARSRVWLHLLLFAVALFTTTLAGAAFDHAFQENRAISDQEIFPGLLPPFPLAAGLPYAFTLLAILFAHEMGHYIACRYYGIQASLPYFLGVPTLIGTFGAFIRIHSPIPTRRQLFDVGVAGPLAGFVLVLPALAIGLALSKVIPGVAESGDIVFGTPLVLRFLEAAIFPGVPSADIALHPIARAAWVGALATALNLMPIGQLDGGHILYALAGRWHKRITWMFIGLLIPCGLLFSWSWLLWAAILLVAARRHPRIYDETPVGRGRLKLGLLSLVIFVLSFTLVPVRI